MGSKKQNRKCFYQKNLEKSQKNLGRRTVAQELRSFYRVLTGAFVPPVFFLGGGTGNRKKLY
jgi:hypothetical protein